MKTIIEIHNSYCKLLGYIPVEIEDACTLYQQVTWKQRFLLSHQSNNPKFAILNYEPSLLGQLCKKNYDGFEYAIPLKSKGKYKDSSRIITCFVFDKKPRVYYNTKTQTFPSGWLFSKVVKTLKKQNLSYEIKDVRTKLEKQPLKKDLPFPLRCYQEEAVKTAIVKERGILQIGTGGGKSIIATEIINRLGLPTMYIVPNLNLINQTHKILSEILGKDIVGFIGDGSMEIKQINVATQQTLWSRKNTKEIKNLFKSTQVLILDEAHKVERTSAKSKYVGNTWYRLAMLFENARFRIGMTATPGTENQYNRQLLEAVTGNLFIERSVDWLIKNGYLTQPLIKIYYNDVKKMKPWTTARKYGIDLNTKRNALIVSIAKKFANKNKKVLIVVDRITTQGKAFEEALPNAGVIYGEHTSKERKEIFEDFQDGSNKILISSVVKEGVDLPEMDVIIMASGGKGSENGRATMQRLGRVLRLSKGKDSAFVIDFYDCDDGILEKHSKIRLNTYKKYKSFKIEEIR